MPDKSHALSRLPDNDFSNMGLEHFFCHIYLAEYVKYICAVVPIYFELRQHRFRK